MPEASVVATLPVPDAGVFACLSVFRHAFGYVVTLSGRRSGCVCPKCGEYRCVCMRGTRAASVTSPSRVSASWCACAAARSPAATLCARSGSSASASVTRCPPSRAAQRGSSEPWRRWRWRRARTSPRAWGESSACPAVLARSCAQRIASNPRRYPGSASR